MQVTYKGALPDGSGDSKSGIQSSFNITNTNPYGTFRHKQNFGSGYYVTTGTITMRRGAGIEGDGLEATRLVASYASASGDPMLSGASCPDWRIENIRLEGADKAAGLVLENSYFGVADQVHFNGMTPYGVKLIESAQSTFRTCSFYYYPNVTDVAALIEGGSMSMFANCQFDSQCIGIKSSTSGLGSGVRVFGSSFGAQYPALKIGNGDSLWDIQSCYFEGDPAETPQDIVEAGAFDGGGGASKTNVNFNSNQVAGSNNNDIEWFQVKYLNMHFNEIGTNVEVGADVEWLYATGNWFASGKALTDNAAFSTVEARNDRRMSSEFGTRQDYISDTVGVTTVAYSRDLLSYVAKTVDAASFEWRVGASTTKKLGLSADGDLKVPRKVYPGALGASPAQQTATGHWGGTGAPDNAHGSNGDFYFRSDGGASTTIYHKRAGAWVGVV